MVEIEKSIKLSGYKIAISPVAPDWDLVLSQYGNQLFVFIEKERDLQTDPMWGDTYDYAIMSTIIQSTFWLHNYRLKRIRCSYEDPRDPTNKKLVCICGPEGLDWNESIGTENQGPSTWLG